MEISKINANTDATFTSSVSGNQASELDSLGGTLNWQNNKTQQKPTEKEKAAQARIEKLIANEKIAKKYNLTADKDGNITITLKNNKREYLSTISNDLNIKKGKIQENNDIAKVATNTDSERPSSPDLFRLNKNAALKVPAEDFEDPKPKKGIGERFKSAVKAFSAD